jgi:Flp pilus assembly protein TadB
MPEDPSNTDEGAPSRGSGKATLVLRAQEVAEEKAAKRREEDREANVQADARVDAANARTLSQAVQRAEDARTELDRKDKNWKEAMAGKDKQIKFQWFIIALLVAALLVAVFDKTVGFDWTKGTVNAGSDLVEAGP